MAIRERAPRSQRERKQSLDAASIAGRVAGVVENLQKDSQEIQNPHELCRRADAGMIAALQLVAPVLPKRVKTQVKQLIRMHHDLYQAALPSLKQPDQASLTEKEDEPQPPQTRRLWQPREPKQADHL